MKWFGNKLKVSKASSSYTISRRTGLFLVLLVGVLVVMNAALIIQNRKLKKSGIGINRSIILNEGTVVPSLSGIDLNGNKLTLDYGNDRRRALVLVFSPLCRFCTENMPTWQALAQGLDRKSYRIVAVSVLTEGVKEYMSQHELSDVPVIAEVDPKSRVSYEMAVTPQTILIDSDGKVEKVWTGFIQADERNEIERVLGLKLPTISQNIRLDSPAVR